MRELSLFLSIDNFAKFDASCQLHLNPRKYQTWFSCCIFRLEQVHQWWSLTTWRWTTTRERSGWAPPSATRSLNAPEWKRWKNFPHKEKQEIDSDLQVFFLVLLLVMIGEFFASPAIALADSAVIQSLGEKQVLAPLFSSKCQLWRMLTAYF